jgi:hypothetical protein
MRQILSNQLDDLHARAESHGRGRRAAELLGAEQTDWFDGFDGASDMPSGRF